MLINEVEKARRLVQLREATAKFYSVADCKQALQNNDWDVERAKLTLQPADVSAILADGYLLYKQQLNVPIVDVNCEPGLKIDWDWIVSNIEFKSGGESVTLLGCSKCWK